MLHSHCEICVCVALSDGMCVVEESRHKWGQLGTPERQEPHPTPSPLVLRVETRHVASGIWLAPWVHS